MVLKSQHCRNPKKGKEVIPKTTVISFYPFSLPPTPYCLLSTAACGPVLQYSRYGASTTSLGKLFQHLEDLTARIFPLKSSLDVPVLTLRAYVLPLLGQTSPSQGAVLSRVTAVDIRHRLLERSKCVQYLVPATAPSFFPKGSSSSTPHHSPLAKSVSPT